MEIVCNQVVYLCPNKTTVGRRLDLPDNTLADDVNLEVSTRVRSSPETFKQAMRIKKCDGDVTFGVRNDVHFEYAKASRMWYYDRTMRSALPKP